VEGASRTAQYVALFRALESLGGDALFRDPYAERFLDARLRAVVAAARLPGARSLITAYIDRRWPGPRISAVRRTAMIDQAVREGVAAGCEQAVILGAGYDARAHRMPELAGVDVFEVDLPSTQARKRTVMGDGRVHYVAVDFAHDDLAAAMRAAGLDGDRRTVIIWEGVLSYLELGPIDATLRWMATAVAAGSRAIITYVNAQQLDGSRSAWIDAVADVGEPFVTGLDPAEVESFLGERGLALLSDAASDDRGFYRVAVCGVPSTSGSPRRNARTPSASAPSSDSVPSVAWTDRTPSSDQ
jgi:methyltransferase (TIGR00027 family)